MIQLTVSRDKTPNGSPIAHYLNENGKSLCCDRRGELFNYDGNVSVFMCGACVMIKTGEFVDESSIGKTVS